MAEAEVSAYAAAAKAIADATHMLVATGAGFSADSGLPTYAAMPESYHDLCRIETLLEQHVSSYGFWARSVRAYRAATPHVGYAILDRWLGSKPKGNVQVYTSNVDGLARRFESLKSQLCELHGCVEEWACGSSMGFAYDESQPSQLRSRGGAVFAAHNSRVTEAVAAEAVTAEVSAASSSPWPSSPWPASCATWRVSPSDAAIDTLIAICPDDGSIGSEATGSSVELEEDARVQWSHSPPICQCCGLPIRPCVLMFGDTDPVLLRRLKATADAYQAWEDSMEATVISEPNSYRLVVLEIGCGERVPSVRLETEAVVGDVLERGGRATLIRLNPEGVLPEAPGALREHTLLLRATAAAALTRLDALVS